MRLCPPLLAAGSVVLLGAGVSVGAVTLSFGDKDATPTSTIVPAGATFPVDVFLTATSASDKISGVDYRLAASSSGLFRLLARKTTAVLSNPFTPDSDPTVAPVTLSPTNGTTNLGGQAPANNDLSGSATTATFELFDLTVQALPGTPVGIYTLSFVPGQTFYEGATSAMSPTLQYASLGTFTVTVPEPATGGLLAGLALAGLRRRRHA